MPAAVRKPWLALAALVTAGFDFAAFVLLQLVQPEVNVLHEPTSAYVHGAFGIASSLAGAAVGIGGLALAAAAWGAVRDAGAKAGAALLGVFGIAKLAQAFFPIDAAGESTAAGATHNLLGNLAFFVLPVAAVLVTRAIAHATGHGASPWPAVAAWTLVATTALVLAGDGLGFFGLAQRIYLLSAMGWTALAAGWLWRPKN